MPCNSKLSDIRGSWKHANKFRSHIRLLQLFVSSFSRFFSICFRKRCNLCVKKRLETRVRVPKSQGEGRRKIYTANSNISFLDESRVNVRSCFLSSRGISNEAFTSIVNHTAKYRYAPVDWPRYIQGWHPRRSPIYRSPRNY